MTTLFRRVTPDDRDAIQAISDATWDGEDFLGRVFDQWVADENSAFLGLIHEGRFLGCGRILALDRRRAWLEGLRVHPSAQGLGLGRALAHRLFRLGDSLGFKELLFATYFQNHASIHLSERAGFRPVSTYSLLSLDLVPRQEEARIGGQDRPEAPRPEGADAAVGEDRESEGADEDRESANEDRESGARNESSRRNDRGAIGAVSAAAEGFTADLAPLIRQTQVIRGFLSLPGWMSADWLFVPPDLADRGRFFRHAAAVVGKRITMAIAQNPKYADSTLDICGLTGPPDADPRACLHRVLVEARSRGLARVQVMLPVEHDSAPYLEAGFRSYEREADVILYSARSADLELPPEGPISASTSPTVPPT